MAGLVQPQAYFRLLTALDPGAGADEVGQLRILTSTAVPALPGRHHDAGYPPDERAIPRRSRRLARERPGSRSTARGPRVRVCHAITLADVGAAAITASVGWGVRGAPRRRGPGR